MKKLTLAVFFGLILSVNTFAAAGAGDNHINNASGNNVFTSMDDTMQGNNNVLHNNQNYNANTNNLSTQSGAFSGSNSYAKTEAESNATSNSNSNSNSGGNTLTGGSNTNGGNSVNIDNPRQAPPAVAPSMSASGNNSYTGGFSTPFGGISGGISKVDKTQKELNRSLSNLNNAQSVVMLSNCDSAECKVALQKILKNIK